MLIQVRAFSFAIYLEARLTCVLLSFQVNTSGEENKSGLPPLTSTDAADAHELVKLAVHVLENCPFLRLQGLMTIGSIEQSIHAKEGEENHDFKTLLSTRDALQEVLRSRFADRVGTPSSISFFCLLLLFLSWLLAFFSPSTALYLRFSFMYSFSVDQND